jgi:D-beta-D-heptose 7-phosphate kinase/D-beta-D-heptose 1-phosphate adenosyltransferase
MKRILVVGESCLDIFVYCNANRLCPDIPVPVLSVIHQTENPGMAMNVERNMVNLGLRCRLVTNSNWRDITKTRFMHRATNHMWIRVDSDPEMEKADVKSLNLDDYDVVAISDYNKGFLSTDDIRHICDHHETVFIDTKKVLGRWAEGARYIKINSYEYKNSIPYISKALAEKLIWTDGDRGAVYLGKTYPVPQKVEVRDLSGAGDTFFAALIAKYTETDDIGLAITFANHCASKVVQHKGVSVIQKEEADSFDPQLM